MLDINPPGTLNPQQETIMNEVQGLRICGHTATCNLVGIVETVPRRYARFRIDDIMAHNNALDCNQRIGYISQ